MDMKSINVTSFKADFKYQAYSKSVDSFL